jgi:hypothetical protein
MSFFSPNSEKIIKQSRASTAEKLAINALLAITTTSTTRRTTTSTTTTKSTKRKRGGQRKQKTKKKTDVSTKNKKGSLTKPATLPLPSAAAPGSPSTHPRSVMTGEEKVSSAFNNGMFSIFFYFILTRIQQSYTKRKEEDKTIKDLTSTKRTHPVEPQQLTPFSSSLSFFFLFFFFLFVV